MGCAPGEGPDERGRWPVEPGRYRLIWSRACPWASRAVIVRGQPPGFGDTVDFDHIKRHHFGTHAAINPTGIVPVGPDLSGWRVPPGMRP